MRDVNWSLRKAYFTALSGITYLGDTVPVYYKQLPTDQEPDNYIIFDGISNNDISTMNSADTFTSIRVKIHTHKETYNDGKAADYIAGEVLSRIYPDSQTNLDLSADNFQIVKTELTSDTIDDWEIENQRVYCDRSLTFRHRIFHR